MTAPTDLKQRLDALPAELWTYIFDLTFTQGPNTVHITPSYQPPATLQVSRSTRALFASRYYPSCTFHCHSSTPSARICISWLCSLSKEHLALLREVHEETVSDGWLGQLFDYRVKMRQAHILQDLNGRGVPLAEGVLKVKVKRGGEGTWEWDLGVAGGF